MSRMGIQVLHDQGVGRYYPSSLFRGLGQKLDPLVLKYPIEPNVGWSTSNTISSASSGNGGYE
jgi:hypothetical protein